MIRLALSVPSRVAHGVGQERVVWRRLLRRVPARALSPFVAGGIALFVYVRTLLSGVGWGDVADLQTVPKVLGVSHPTGYPLWTLLGFLWTRLPLGNSAFRMNLFSAVAVASAVGVLAVVAMRLGVRAWLAAITGLVFAFARLTWFLAGHAEVQTLHVLLVALLILAWMRAEQSGSGRDAVLMFAAAGIGIANHALMALTAPLLIAWYVARHWQVIGRLRILVVAAAAGTMPLLLYLYLPIRGAHGAPVVNSNPAHGWFAVIAGGESVQKARLGSLQSVSLWWHALGADLRLTAGWLGWLVVIFAAVGIVALARRSPAMLVGLLLVIVASTYGLAAHFQGETRYLLAPLWVVALLAGVAAEELTRRLSALAGPQQRLVAGALVLVCALVPLSALHSNYSANDESGTNVASSDARNILVALPPHAVIWAYWDVRTALQYEHFVEGVRPDVTILDHRSVQAFGPRPRFDQVAAAAALDPALAGRPLGYIPEPHLSDPSLPSTAGTDYQMRRIIPIDRPYGFAYFPDDWLYVIAPKHA